MDLLVPESSSFSMLLVVASGVVVVMVKENPAGVVVLGTESDRVFVDMMKCELLSCGVVWVLNSSVLSQQVLLGVYSTAVERIISCMKLS